VDFEFQTENCESIEKEKVVVMVYPKKKNCGCLFCTYEEIKEKL